MAVWHAEIDGAGPEHVALGVDHDSRRADVDVVGDEGLRLDEPGAKRTISPVTRLETNSAPSGAAVMLSGKNAGPGSDSSLGLDARAAADPVAITNPAASSTTPRIRPMSRPSLRWPAIAVPRLEGRPCREVRGSPRPRTPSGRPDPIPATAGGRPCSRQVRFEDTDHDWRQRRSEILGYGGWGTDALVVPSRRFLRAGSQVRRFRRAATKESPRRPIASRFIAEAAGRVSALPLSPARSTQAPGHGVALCATGSTRRKRT